MPSNTVLTYPIPAYSNVPIHAEFYQPNTFVISAISLGQITTITTTEDNTFVIGQQVRLLIPNKYGSTGLNEKTGYVIGILAPNEVQLDINSSGIDPFIPNPTFVMFQSKILPQIIAIGDVNSGVINANGRSPQGTYISGSFINISPL